MFNSLLMIKLSVSQVVFSQRTTCTAVFRSKNICSGKKKSFFFHVVPVFSSIMHIVICILIFYKQFAERTASAETLLPTSRAVLNESKDINKNNVCALKPIQLTVKLRGVERGESGFSLQQLDPPLAETFISSSPAGQQRNDPCSAREPLSIRLCK